MGKCPDAQLIEKREPYERLTVKSQKELVLQLFFASAAAAVVTA